MINLRIPCMAALSFAIAVACNESGAGGYESEATAGDDLVQPAEVQRDIENALDQADSQITSANAEDELRKLENEIDSDG